MFDNVQIIMVSGDLIIFVVLFWLVKMIVEDSNMFVLGVFVAGWVSPWLLVSG